jgi:hypothetical protein
MDVLLQVHAAQMAFDATRRLLRLEDRQNPFLKNRRGGPRFSRGVLGLWFRSGATASNRQYRHNE